MTGMFLSARRGISGESGIDTTAFEVGAAGHASAGETPVFVAMDGVTVGLLAIADPMRPTSPPAIRRLKAMGLDVMLLTGDVQHIGEAVARAAGIDNVVSGVLPAGKHAKIAATTGRSPHGGHEWATASTTHPRSPRQTLAWPWGADPTLPLPRAT